MSLEIFFSWTLMIIPVLILVKDVRDGLDWPQKIYRWGIYVLAIFLFWSFHEMVEIGVENFVTNTILNSSDQEKAAMVITSLMLMIIFGVIWHLLNWFIIKPKTTFAKINTWAITIIGASAAASIYYGTAKNLTDLTPIVVAEAGVFLSLSIAIYWKAKLQNALAIPCALTLAVGATLYYHYCRTGINIVEMYKLDPMSIGPWVIALAIGTAYSTLLDKGELWNERYAYKVINLYLIAMMGMSIWLGVANFYGSNAIEKSNKAKMNILQEKLLKKKLEKIEASTFAELVEINISANNKTYLEKIKKAEGEESIQRLKKELGEKNAPYEKLLAEAKEGGYADMTSTEADWIQRKNSSYEELLAVDGYRRYINQLMEDAVYAMPDPDPVYNTKKITDKINRLKFWGDKEPKRKEVKIRENDFIPYSQGEYKMVANRGKATTEKWIRLPSPTNQFKIKMDYDLYSYYIKTRSGRIIPSTTFKKGGCYIQEDFIIIANSDIVICTLIVI